MIGNIDIKVIKGRDRSFLTERQAVAIIFRFFKISEQAVRIFIFYIRFDRVNLPFPFFEAVKQFIFVMKKYVSPHRRTA